MIATMNSIKNEVVCLTDIKDSFDINFYRKTLYANSKGDRFYLPLIDKTYEDTVVILSSKRVGVIYIKDDGNGRYRLNRLSYIGDKVYIIRYNVTKDILNLLITIINR